MAGHLASEPKGGSYDVRVNVYMQPQEQMAGLGARPCFHLCAENDRRAAMFSVPEALSLPGLDSLHTLHCVATAYRADGTALLAGKSICV